MSSSHDTSPVRTAIGLEIHVQLQTATKLFCADPASPAAEPNMNVCPVCLGLPGALPVLNGAAVELAARTALALGCTVHERSEFDRKSYFYPDLPKGYQITQLRYPLASVGTFEGVGIRRLHLEEDAGRLLHDRVAERTAVDLNRAGVPLMEIVTEPDVRGPAAARAFLVRLRQLLRYIEVSDCEMENGSLRVDVNVSVPDVRGRPGEPVEIKNLNSFAHVESALEHEIARQRALVDAGGTVERETRLWDPVSRTTRRLRGKEASRHYRYLPEPDVPSLVLGAVYLRAIGAAMPELPAAKAARFVAAYDLPAHDAEVLTADRALAEYFEAVAHEVDAKAASSWIMTDVLGWLNRRGLRVQSLPVAPQDLADLIRLVLDGAVSRRAARQVLEAMAETGTPARMIIAAQGLEQVSDDGRIAAWIEQVLAAHPDEAAAYRAGRTKVMSYLIGQVLELSGGAADPRRSGELLRRSLER